MKLIKYLIKFLRRNLFRNIKKFFFKFKDLNKISFYFEFHIEYMLMLLIYHRG